MRFFTSHRTRNPQPFWSLLALSQLRWLPQLPGPGAVHHAQPGGGGASDQLRRSASEGPRQGTPAAPPASLAGSASLPAPFCGADGSGGRGGRSREWSDVCGRRREVRPISPLRASHRRREAHPLLPLPPLSGMRCPRRTRQRSCRLWRGRSPVPGSRCVALLAQTTACPVSPSTCATLTGACSSRHRRIRPPIQRLHRCKAMRRQLGCVSHRSSRPRQFLSHPAPIMTRALCVLSSFAIVTLG